MSQKIAVIAGAGPAGLTAAYELRKRSDIRPVVYEETDAIGGIAQTHCHEGNRIDIGGHRFFSKSDRVMDWWFRVMPPQGAPAADTAEKEHEIDYAAEVLVEYLCPECAPDGKTEHRRTAPDPEREDRVMLQRPRISRIFYRRRFFPYPLSISFGVALQLGLFNTALIGLSYIRSRLFPIRDETYLDAFFINRFGRRLYATFFRDYTEKVWGVPCEKIRADWGAQRVKGLSLKRAVVQAVRDLLTSGAVKSQRERETSLITRFFYPKYGPGQMWETVTDELRSCGVEVSTGHRVTGLKVSNGRVASATVESNGSRREVPCDWFVSTMPIRHLVAMVDPPPPPEVREVAEGLVYRDFLTVGLLLTKLHVREAGREPSPDLPDNWIYVQEGDVKVGRIQLFHNWSPYMVADRKNRWIGLEYFVDEGDELWRMADRDLIALGTRELQSIDFLRPEDVLDGCVLRMRKAYPSYFGSYDRLDVIRKWAEGIENLFLVGRNGMHRYNNQDHSMLTAMMAVDNILEGRTDKSNLWEVNLEMVYHEEKDRS